MSYRRTGITPGTSRSRDPIDVITPLFISVFLSGRLSVVILYSSQAGFPRVLADSHWQPWAHLGLGAHYLEKKQKNKKKGSLRMISGFWLICLQLCFYSGANHFDQSFPGLCHNLNPKPCKDLRTPETHRRNIGAGFLCGAHMFMV